jgi:hypothetical protein
MIAGRATSEVTTRKQLRPSSALSPPAPVRSGRIFCHMRNKFRMLAMLDLYAVSGFIVLFSALLTAFYNLDASSHVQLK